MVSIRRVVIEEFKLETIRGIQVAGLIAEIITFAQKGFPSHTV